MVDGTLTSVNAPNVFHSSTPTAFVPQQYGSVPLNLPNADHPPSAAPLQRAMGDEAARHFPHLGQDQIQSIVDSVLSPSHHLEPTKLLQLERCHAHLASQTHVIVVSPDEFRGNADSAQPHPFDQSPSVTLLGCANDVLHGERLSVKVEPNFHHRTTSGHEGMHANFVQDDRSNGEQPSTRVEPKSVVEEHEVDSTDAPMQKRKAGKVKHHGHGHKPKHHGHQGRKGAAAPAAKKRSIEDGNGPFGIPNLMKRTDRLGHTNFVTYTPPTVRTPKISETEMSSSANVRLTTKQPSRSGSDQAKPKGTLPRVRP